ncbi:hypothetical protein Gohar_002977, partial [Gossypium harknessii]|nr:hypothetical protein [Gossypium harknessii]
GEDIGHWWLLTSALLGVNKVVVLLVGGGFGSWWVCLLSSVKHAGGLLLVRRACLVLEFLGLSGCIRVFIMVDDLNELLANLKFSESEKERVVCQNATELDMQGLRHGRMNQQVAINVRGAIGELLVIDWRDKDGC